MGSPPAAWTNYNITEAGFRSPDPGLTLYFIKGEESCKNKCPKGNKTEEPEISDTSLLKGAELGPDSLLVPGKRSKVR